MSERLLCAQLSSATGQQARLQGWVHRLRDLGGLRFLLLRDRSGLAQVVVPASVALPDAAQEWVVNVAGAVRPEPRAPGGYEVLAAAIEPIAPAQTPPLDIAKPSIGDSTRLDTLLDHRAISLRIPEVLDIFRVQATILAAFRAHLSAQGFSEIATPKLVLAGAEGGSALFEVQYYGRKAYLAQSPQFYKQIMVGSGLERVFEVGHAYRAEKSETSRHIAEFVSLDFEVGFIDSHQDVMAFHTGVLRAIFDAVRTCCGPELARRGIELPELTDVPQITFPEAKRILRERFAKTVGLEGDLDAEGERLLGQWAREELRNDLLYVTGYAPAVRPVYAMRDPADPEQTRSFDLLYKGVEITTGGQRIHLYEDLIAAFRGRGLDPTNYEDYLEAFRHGMPPHGGMGMGLERLTKQMLNLANVKEACLFPRDRNRLRP